MLKLAKLISESNENEKQRNEEEERVLCLNSEEEDRRNLISNIVDYQANTEEDIYQLHSDFDLALKGAGEETKVMNPYTDDKAAQNEYSAGFIDLEPEYEDPEGSQKIEGDQILDDGVGIIVVSSNQDVVFCLNATHVPLE